MSWEDYTDYFKDLEPSDVYNFPRWALWDAHLPRDEQGNVHYGWQDPTVQGWAAQGLAYGAPGIGMTKIVGPAGGNRVIQSISDKTGQLLGELGYKDFPGIGAIIQNFRSKAPEATTEMYQRFGQELGPLLDKVKVSGNIRPEAWQSVQGALDRGVYNEYPNLANQWQRALEESRGRYPDIINNPEPWRWGQ